MTPKRKKEINLGFNAQTKYLISRYRILKALEHASRKFAKNMDKEVKEELNNDLTLAKTLFIEYAYETHENRLISEEDFLRSNPLAIQSSLYRVLKENDMLEEAVAELVYKELNKGNEINPDIIEDYTAHLRYYLSHPEVVKEYKIN